MIHLSFKKHSQQQGFTLIEMLVYIALVAIIIGALVNTLVVLAQSYKQVLASRTLDSSALLSLDRMTSVIRSSGSIDFSNTTLNSSAGVLTLNAHDANGAAYTAKFYVQDGVIHMDTNGVFEDRLTSSSTAVTSLMFRYIDTPVSDAVRIELTLAADVNGYNKVENYYTTAILKNSY